MWVSFGVGVRLRVVYRNAHDYVALYMRFASSVSFWSGDRVPLSALLGLALLRLAL